MVRSDRHKSTVQTMRIVWLVLILGIGTGRSQRQIHPDLSTVTATNNSSFISSVANNNSWNRAASKHFQFESSSRMTNSHQRPCRRCGDECDFEEGNLTCHQVSSFTVECLTTDCSTSIVNLNIVQGRFKNMTESGLLDAEFTSLQRLSIRHSDLTLVELLPAVRNHQLIELNLSNNTNLEYMYWHRIFNNRIAHVEMLILANNTLNYIPDLMDMMNTSTLTTLDLSGNKWDCDRDFQWVLKLHERGVLFNGDNLKCRDNSQNNSWFEWNYSIIRRETNKKTVAAECLSRTSNCSCEFTSEGKEGRVSYTVQVDCSNKQMTSLPAQLPNFTNELDVSGNNLTSLDQVIKYRNQPLKILIADSNQIVSIRNLSTSDFILNFSRLSLRNNFITPNEIPLEDIVQVPASNQFQVKYIYLYNNSWECDCNMATKVRDWLWKYRHVVNDSSLLLCSRDGKKIPVLHLLPNQVCESYSAESAESLANLEEREIVVLHAIIYLEVAAISVLAVKLAYDSWHYFRHGQLPWIATKLL
uniref:Uncharacterized protein n=1 Tax=Daphnia galeata TaxID=27404 RepID=A0A8J2WCP6_9CRUS|nr:unnamed protein product [Daphnia galeata]